MEQTNSKPSPLIKLIWSTLGFTFVCSGFIFNATPFGVIMSILGTVLLVTKSFYLKQVGAANRRAARLQEDTPALYQTLSEKDLIKHLLARELQYWQRNGEKIRCKAALTRKTVYSAVAILLFVVCLFATYYQGICVPLSCMILLVFVWLWNRATPEQVLYEKAKKNKQLPFSQLVKDNVYDEAVTPKARRRSILALGILISLLGLFFQNTTETKLKYTPTDGGVMLTSYRPALKELKQATVPRTVDGQPVVAIADGVFKNFSYLEAVTLPNTVRSIGSRAFENCSDLEQIVLPEGLTALGGEAFMNCAALTAIQIPQGVTELRGNTFEDCEKLVEVQLHDGITAIHAYCFRGCKSLEAIQLPSNITEIRTYTFEGCSSLKAIEIPAGVTRIASHAFHNCTALSDVSLPDTLQELGRSAFRNCTSLLFIDLPKGVTMEENTFKESPTRIGEKKYTDAQWVRIVQEFEVKPWPTPVYYMYNLDKGPDAICRYGTEGYVVLTDSAAYPVTDGRSLQLLEDNAALLALLEKAENAGVPFLRIHLYTQVGSQITGNDEFVYSDYDINQLASQLKAVNEDG